MTYLNGSNQQVKSVVLLILIDAYGVKGKHFLCRTERTVARKEKDLFQHGLLGTWQSKQHELRSRGEPFLAFSDSGPEE